MIVLVTCPSMAVARRLANRLIGDRAAACVNMLPGITSTFRWEGKIDRCREVLLLIKTTAGAFARVKKLVTALHPYEVPEIIAAPIVAGHAPYLRWVQSMVAAHRPLQRGHS